MSRYLVIDVESIGLHGEGFAVGYVVLDAAAKVADGYFACPPSAASGEPTDRKWVAENVPPLTHNCETAKEVRAKFWGVWLEQRALGAAMVADCAWPVEAKFLLDCVADHWASRCWEGPYPLHDLASILLAHGKDPLAAGERLPDEPVHHPLGDARQSARVLVEVLHDQH